MKWLTSDNKMLGYELMKAYPNISCFSTTRHGGCSKGNYTSFNCNGYCGDEAEDVNRNRELLRSLLPGESVELVIPHQTHSDHVKVVDTIHVNTELEGVDALVTDIPGYCLCVSTADCVPVLFIRYSKEGSGCHSCRMAWYGGPDCREDSFGHERSIRFAREGSHCLHRSQYFIGGF